MLGQQSGNQQEQATKLLYSGEAFDSSLQQYNLRARHYDPGNGRFNRLDPFSGSQYDPQSLHKYAYCHSDPVNSVDPSGEFTMVQIVMTSAIIGLLTGIITFVWTEGDLQTAFLVGIVAALVVAGLMLLVTYLPQLLRGGLRLTHDKASFTMSSHRWKLLNEAFFSPITDAHKLWYLSTMRWYEILGTFLLGALQNSLTLFYDWNFFNTWAAPTPVAGVAAGAVLLIAAAAIAWWGFYGRDND